MSAAGAHLRLALAVVTRDLRLALSYRMQFLTGLFASSMSLAVFYYISQLVRVQQFTPRDYFAFAAIGIVIFTVVNATVQLPQAALRQELVAGTFERLLLAPRGATAAIVALLAYPGLYALATVTALVGVGAALFHLDLHWSTVPLAVPVGFLSLFAFAPFGVVLLASIVLAKRAPPGTSYLIAGLSLVAGLYFPVALLPEWIRWAADVQPLTPSVELLRWTLVGRPMEDPAWLAFGKLTLFAAVLLPFSTLVLSAALRRSRRRGNILEY